MTDHECIQENKIEKFIETQAQFDNFLTTIKNNVYNTEANIKRIESVITIIEGRLSETFKDFNLHIKESYARVTEIEKLKLRIIEIDNSINSERNKNFTWKVAVIGIAASVLLTVFLQTINLSSRMGNVCRTVEINTVRLDELERIHPRHVSETITIKGDKL
jgi:hypothetical protein